MTFHFLRPEWLIVLVPILIILWFIWRAKAQKGNWQNLIAIKFQKFLLSENNIQQQSNLPLIGLTIIWFVATIALAGPSWQTVEQPSEKVQQGTVILLDNSLSMLAEDIKPSRIVRARFKLMDFINANPHLSTGLVVYSGSAHVLTPISDDNQTILSLLPSINPMIMPAFGADASQGIAKAINLLEQSKINSGHIIWLLDDINKNEISAIKAQLSGTGIKVSLLAIGTSKGAPIAVPDYGLIKDDQGKVVIASLPTPYLHKLANAIDAKLLFLSHDNSDVEQLSAVFSLSNQKIAADEDSENKSVSHWLDKGIYLLIPLVLLIALAYRRGWVLVWVMMLPFGGLYLVSFSPEVYAQQTPEAITNEAEGVSLLDFLKSGNHLGYKLWQQQKYDIALDFFRDSQWQGASYYRLQEFAKAQQKFKDDSSPIGKFNLGNSLAKQGLFAEAQKSFAEALALKPDFTEAQENLAIINKIINKEQEQKQQKTDKGQDAKQEDSQGTKDSEQESAEDGKQSPEDGDATNEQPKQEQPTQQDEKQDIKEPKPQKDELKEAENEEQAKQSDPQASKADEPEQEEAMADIAKRMTEEEQAKKAWLNQIPDEPGLFLKNKFEHQYQQQKLKHNDKDSQNDKIW